MDTEILTAFAWLAWLAVLLRITVQVHPSFWSIHHKTHDTTRHDTMPPSWTSQVLDEAPHILCMNVDWLWFRPNIVLCQEDYGSQDFQLRTKLFGGEERIPLLCCMNSFQFLLSQQQRQIIITSWNVKAIITEKLQVVGLFSSVRYIFDRNYHKVEVVRLSGQEGVGRTSCQNDWKQATHGTRADWIALDGTLGWTTSIAAIRVTNVWCSCSWAPDIQGTLDRLLWKTMTNPLLWSNSTKPL